MGTAHSLAICVLWLLLVPMASAHPEHDSYTEIAWNKEGGSLEVSMRIVPEELETALAWASVDGVQVVLENKLAAEPMVASYLTEHFQVRNAASELMPVTLVGLDISYAESWLYFTIAASSNDSLYLRNSVLLELDNRQINRVRRLWIGPADTYLHNQSSPEQLLWRGR